MAAKLNDSVRLQLRAILAERYGTWAEASRQLGMTQTWLGRRLNAQTELSLTDVELICSRLDIPLSEVLRGEDS